MKKKLVYYEQMIVVDVTSLPAGDWKFVAESSESGIVGFIVEHNVTIPNRSFKVGDKICVAVTKVTAGGPDDD